MKNELLTPPPAGGTDVLVIGLLAALVLLCLGCLIGYVIGKNHRRAFYRQQVKELEGTLAFWRRRALKPRPSALNYENA